MGGAGAAFYSIMFNVLTSQQAKYLTNSTNSFAYSLETYKQDIEEEAALFLSNEILNTSNKSVFDKYRSLDFIFKVVDDSLINLETLMASPLMNIPRGMVSIRELQKANPLLLISSFTNNKEEKYYYGKLITQELLSQFAKRINAEVALVSQDNIIDYSNSAINQMYFYNINKANAELLLKNNYDIYSEETDNSYFLASLYRIKNKSFQSYEINAIIFTNVNEVVSLQNNLFNILILLGMASISLSFILTLLFTSRLRNQIQSLSESTQITKSGDFHNRLLIESKDEIGELASAFNQMLDELERNEKAKTEYTEFITLINQNPTMKEISESALRKIVTATGVVSGALYAVVKNDIQFINSHGIDKEIIPSADRNNFYKTVIESAEPKEMFFESDAPKVLSGLLEIEIRYLLIIPILYSNKVIAVLELASVSKLGREAKDYLEKIKEQLAVGLTNAMAFLQLENFVNELKVLNEDYQNQNIRIKLQNETLVELHNEITIKAKELEIQKKKAEELTELKSQFLATMSHELRTPMNAILGLSELVLEDKTLVPKNKERLSVVIRSGKRLLNLINDVLELSKIEAGKMEIKCENFLLEDLIAEVSASMQPIAAEKKLELRLIRKNSTNIYVTTDKTKLLQILINLIGNAIKFTEIGFVEFRISVEANNFIVFEVADTGIGISKTETDIIFEEFRQADSSITRKFGGTGLGLSICKKFAELLKATISVSSEIGKGSLFEVKIPLAVTKDTECLSISVRDSNAFRNNLDNTVLVIDDDSDTRYSISQYLNNQGYETVIAETGSRGVQLAKRIHPFAITLDLFLPDIDGWSIIKELKSDSETKDIPIILASMIGDKKIGFGLGVFDFMIKPFSSEVIKTALLNVKRLTGKEIQKIALVNDDFAEYEIIKNSVKNENILVESIIDNSEAFNKIIQVKPDLVILDLLTHNGNGLLLAQKLHSNIATKKIPIMLCMNEDLSHSEKNELEKAVKQIASEASNSKENLLKIIQEALSSFEGLTSVEVVQGFSQSGESNESYSQTQEGISYTINNGKIGEVLIVDDDPDSLFTINEIVQKCNCKTLLAKSGSDCLEILETKNPDMILLDIMMPGLDGFQTVKLIREMEKFSSIPVLAVTAKAMVEEKKVIYKYGFDGFVSKPINPGLLAFKITKFLTQKNKAKKNA